MTNPAAPTMSVETALYLAQFARCFHCGEFMNQMVHDGLWRPTREHLVAGPYRRFARASSQAIVLAHRHCNAARASRPPTVDEGERALKVWQQAATYYDIHGAGGAPFDAWFKAASDVQSPGVQAAIAAVLAERAAA